MKRNTDGLLVLFLCLVTFMISPMLSLMLSFVNLIMSKKTSRHLYFIFFLMISLTMGGINATKHLDSDIVNYHRYFVEVPQNGLYETLLEIGGGLMVKEPLYGLITYIGYYLTFGQFSLFIALLTVAMYMFLFQAIYKFFTYIGIGKGGIVCAVFVLAFFPQYCNLTAHLVRQMLACSVVMYAFVSKIVNGKTKWWYLLSAFLIHTSSALLILLSLLSFLYKKHSLLKLSIILVCFLPIVFLNQQIGSLAAGLFGNLYLLSHGFQRLAQNSMNETAIPLSLMLLVFLPLIFIAFKKMYIDSRTSEKIFPLLNVLLLLICFVLSFTHNTLIQYRYFYYSYAFLPFVIPLAVKASSKFSSIYYLSVSLFFLIYFLGSYDGMGGFVYAPLSEILFMPYPFTLFFHS